MFAEDIVKRYEQVSVLITHFHTDRIYGLIYMYKSGLKKYKGSDINEIVSKTDYPVYDSYKFIKVPHHGTRTHYYDFLKYNPAYILISNGVVKGHENDDAYKIDKRYGALNAEHFCSNSNNCLCCMKSCNSNLYCCGKTKNIVFPSIYKVIR